MTTPAIRAALERWRDLAETDLLCPGNPAETDWGAVVIAIAATRAALAQPEEEGLPPRVGHILRLAAIICRVDGNHDKGAAALAEAILSHPDSRWQPAQPEEEGPTDEEIAECLIDAGVDTMEGESDGTGRTPQPIPVSERLPGEGDCDAEGRCWIGTWSDIDGEPTFDWAYTPPRDWTWEGIAMIQYWLPYWALPLPQREQP